jgi:hypothetical protein
MAFDGDVFVGIKSGPRGCEVPIAGFQAFPAADTNPFVYNPGICPGLLVHLQCGNGTGPKTGRVEALKTDPGLVIPSQVVLIQDYSGEGSGVPPIAIEIGAYRLTGATTRADRLISQDGTSCQGNSCSVGKGNDLQYIAHCNGSDKGKESSRAIPEEFTPRNGVGKEMAGFRRALRNPNVMLGVFPCHVIGVLSIAINSALALIFSG